MTLFLIALAVLALGYYLFVQKPAPLKHRDLTPERLLKLVQALYFRGFDGARLTLHLAGAKEPVLELSKRIVQDNDVRLSGRTVLIRDAPDYHAFVRELSAIGVSYEEQVTDGRATADGVAECHITMSFGNDLAEVCRVARARFEAMGRSVAGEGFLCLHDVIERNVRIGWTS